MKNKLVLKLSLVLALLLSVVLYKMNDFYRQEKMFQAESQVKKQITAIKTSVAAQITTIKNVVSSYSVDIKESQINWVQLDPFFALARVQKRSDGTFTVLQVVGRSGTMAERWNAAYLEKALAVHKAPSDKSIQARLFKDRSGGKYITLIFNNSDQQQTAVVGSADYFQKFFDLDRDGRMISLLVTNDHVLVAHTESDYIASLSDEDSLSPKKYAIEKEEIAGTNLMAVSYTLRRAVAAAWVVPWSVVGLVAGFGFVLVGLLFYGLDPLERKVERYKKQEREQIFKETLQSENAAVQENLVANGVIPKSDLPTKPAPAKSSDFELIQKTREDSVDRAHQAFAEPTETLSDNSLMGPLKQALANLDVVFKQEKIMIETDISSSLTYPIYYGAFIKTFENLLRNAVEAMTDTYDKKITIRAYDIDGLHTVIEIQDNGMGLSIGSSQGEKIWQPFYTTKSKSEHMGLGLTESLSSVRRAGGDLSIESLPISGVLVKMIMKKEKAMTANELAQTERTQIAFTEPLVRFDANSISADDLNPEVTKATFIGDEAFGEGFGQNEVGQDTVTKLIEPKSPEDELLDIDLDDVLSLDESESAYLFTPQKINLEADMASQIKSTKAPDFKFQKKTTAVDQFATRIRRPEKS